jgi:hypothetical protein
MQLSEILGRCLCGEIHVAVAGLPDEISACHCKLCTRWSGGIQFGIETPADKVKITGPLKVHRSSRLAERAWCDTCGSSVWLRDVEGRGAAYLELCPGLFENAGSGQLTRVVYADRAPDGYSLAGDHERVSKAQYEAEYPHLNEEV